MIDSSNDLTPAQDASRSADWPALDFEAARETYATLHMWTQIVWQDPAGADAVGQSFLACGAVPDGARLFQIDFDFLVQRLLIASGDGASASLPLEPGPVARFYRDLMGRLDALGLGGKIHPAPNEVVDPIRFDQDDVHASYDADADAAQRLWRALAQADRVFKRFRGGYAGKCSPVHFFWGSFDLAVTRFSGRAAPAHPGGVPNLPDWVAREAYSHEVSSAGFWPGGAGTPYPVFYSYAYPEPPGFAAAALRPAQARYDATLREWLLPYEAVRLAASPDRALLDFLEGSYAAAADLGQWNRRELDYARRAGSDGG